MAVAGSQVARQHHALSGWCITGHHAQCRGHFDHRPDYDSINDCPCDCHKKE